MPKSAVQAEANGDSTIDIEWGGATYKLPLDVDRWPLTTLAHMEAGRAVSAVEALLGDQYAGYLATEPTVGDFREFFDEIARRCGFGGTGKS